MDIRNVQKTGNMHYVYMPTAWCKKNKIASDSKVAIEMNNDGSLTIHPQLVEKKSKELKLTIDGKNCSSNFLPFQFNITMAVSTLQS